MSPPLSIAMVAAMPYPSGQGTQALVHEMARGLTDRGHRVHLVCYHHGAFHREEPFGVHRIPGMPGYHRLRSGPDAFKPVLDLLLAWRAARVVRDHRCSIVHAHNYEGALAGWWAARACGVPLVYHAHNLMEDELPRYFGSAALGSAAGVLGAGLDRIVPRLGDRVVVLHERLADVLIARGVAADRLSVLPPGIDLDFWTGEETRAEPRPFAVYSGNLDGYQDLPTLFRAMPRVAMRVPGARLLVATPNDVSEGRRMAEREGAGRHVEVIFTPDAAATRRVLHSAVLAVCPRSSWSGFPVKNLNAQAAGLPVVACQGSAYGFEPGRTGLAVPDRDPDALADAIASLLAEPRRARFLGAAGRQLARARFSRERMVDGLERIFEALPIQS